MTAASTTPASTISAPALPDVTQTGLAVDHVGIVVHDLAREVMHWRGLGFQVSDPVALMGTGAGGKPEPLGQASAHIVFENAYIELSAPDPGKANHLLPYVALGEGVRILVLAVPDATASRVKIVSRWPATAPVREASRAIAIEGVDRLARFRWFPLPFDIVPGVLSALVEHVTPEFVFHASLTAHPNGARRISRFIASGRGADIIMPPGCDIAGGHTPPLTLLAAERGARIDAAGINGAREDTEQIFPLRR